MATSLHEPVMVEEVLAALGPPYPDVMLDGTVGMGGHAEALLRRGGARRLLIGLDRDPQALAFASERLAEYGARVRLRQRAFADAADALAEMGLDGTDGLLVDLGVSSLHLDRPERGFSFQQPGPLDMRMSDEGETAGELLRRLDAETLASYLRQYGDVPAARRIARRIVEAAGAGELNTTADLSEVVMRAAPPALKRRKVHPATMVFQAIRIAVNDEVGQLERLLSQLPRVLNPGGRAVFISFHSVEDRLVKHGLRELCGHGRGPRGPYEGEELDHEPVELELANRKPITPAEDEVRRNPRARSAKLRAVRRRTLKEAA